MIFFSSFCRSGFLEFEVGSVITILDKTSDLWSGVRDETGHVGLFMPSQTVTYLGTIPKNSVSTPNNSGNSSNNFGNIFNSAASRNKKRLSRELIQSPQDFLHTRGKVLSFRKFQNVSVNFAFIFGELCNINL